jgi:hypothetical protein
LDRKNPIRIVASEIEGSLKNKDIRGAYGKSLRMVQKHTRTHPKPTRQDEDKTREEYEFLFCAQQATGDRIPIHVNPFAIDDSIPSEQVICEATQKMTCRKAPGGSGIQVERIRQSMQEAKESGDPKKKDIWMRVAQLVQMAFTDLPLLRRLV